MNACAKLAGILHVLNTDDSDLTADTWNDALRLTQWLVDVQVRSVGGFRGAMRGAQSHPPRLTDMERMKALMQTRPAAKFRDLVRSLPKRPRGHWKIEDTLPFYYRVSARAGC